MLGRKGVKGFLLVGHEKVPHGFGLTGVAVATQLMVPGTMLPSTARGALGAILLLKARPQVRIIWHQIS